MCHCTCDLVSSANNEANLASAVHSRAIKAMFARDDLPINFLEFSLSHVLRGSPPEGSTNLVALKLLSAWIDHEYRAQIDLRIGRSASEPVCDRRVS